MKDLPLHLLLFVIASAVIVAISAMFHDSDDRQVARRFPRKLVGFLVGCALVAIIMLVLEHTFASID